MAARKRKSAILETTSESAERLSDLLTLSYEPMLAWRLDGAIEFWNTGAERLYGFASDEALGRSSHSLLQTPALNRLSCQTTRAMIRATRPQLRDLLRELPSSRAHRHERSFTLDSN